jgi:hypothetical protein
MSKTQLKHHIKKTDKKLALAFLDGVMSLQRDINWLDLERAIQDHNGNYVLGVYTPDFVLAAMAAFFEVLNRAYIDAGNIQSELGQLELRRGGITRAFGFDPFQTSVHQRFLDFKDNFIIRFIQSLRETALFTMNQSTMFGNGMQQDAASIANDIKSTIGLTPAQARACDNYRNMLRNRDRQALQRDLRDERFDELIRHHFKVQQGFSEQQIERMVSTYQDRYRESRATQLALMISPLLIDAAGMAFWQDVVNARILPPGLSPLQFWNDMGDERVRMLHQPISEINAQGIPIGGLFETPGGPLKYPRDPDGSPQNTVNCRCYLTWGIG